MDENRKKHFIFDSFFWLFALIWTAAAVKFLLPATLPFWLGLAVAFLLKPVTLWLSRTLHLRRKSVAFAVLLGFYLLVVLILWGICAFCVWQADGFFQSLPQIYSDNIQPFFHRCTLSVNQLLSQFSPGTAARLAQRAQAIAQGFSGSITSLSAQGLAYATALAGRIPFWALTIAFSILCSVFISLDYGAVASFLLRQLPPGGQKLFFRCKEFLTGSLLGMVRAYLLLLLVTFCELAVGFFFLQVENWLFLAAVFSLLDFLPFIGTGLLLIPWGIVELMGGQWAFGAGLLLLYGVVALVRNVLEPKLVSRFIGLPPLVTLVAMYAGLTLCGLPGLLAAPVIALLLRWLQEEGYLRLYR